MIPASRVDELSQRTVVLRREHSRRGPALSDCGELLHVLRYYPGEEYRPHGDTLPGIANQRQWTVLVYLNSDYPGGETRFDQLDITAKGKTGDALVFRDVTREGAGDPRTRHAGLPVTEGVKWVASRWIRTSRYSPWDA